MASKATIKRAHKALTLFCDDLMKRPTYRRMRVNHGGCAVFANMLAELLAKNNILDFKFRVWPESHGDVNDRINLNNIDTTSFNYRILENWAVDHDVSFNHIAIEWNGFIWDAMGAKPTMNDILFMDELPYLGELDWNVVTESSKVEWQWNRAFNRNNMPKLRKTAEECFSAHNLMT